MSRLYGRLLRAIRRRGLDPLDSIALDLVDHWRSRMRRKGVLRG
jgi:hypothetical protein